MISEKQANIARIQYSEYLKELGAHSIFVDKVEEKGKIHFAVIALVLKKPKNPPSFLELDKGEKKIKIPLKFTVSSKFKPEI